MTMKGPRLFLTLAVLFSLLVFVLLGCGAQECPPCPECDPNDFTWSEIEAAIERLPRTPAPELGAESLYAVERIGIKSYEDVQLYNGADFYVWSDEMSTQKLLIDGATGNIDGEGTLDVAGAITGPAIGTENFRLPTIASSTITTDTTGMFTAGATEIWFVHALYCNVTSNFDCTGDDCTLIIGDGSDTDGFAVYIDGELQAADTEMTGAPAGWQGFGGTDTRGAYLAEGLGFVYTNDGIDADFGGTGVVDGSMTCYLVYTKIHE